MHSETRRDWDSTEWENFARKLVQVRHGAQNVQSVPDRVRGDAGVEFFTTDGCCYQCYAPEQSSDTAKAASAMKAKAARDLRKLSDNASIIEDLLQGLKIARWILCCPFLDDKSVISNVRKKADELKISALRFVSDDFQALVHSQADFGSEIATLRSRSLGIPIPVQRPSSKQVSTHSTMIFPQIDAKLSRGLPRMSADRRAKAVRAYARAHLVSETTLDDLRRDFPELWEIYQRTLSAEEDRLQTIGIGETSEQLNSELQRLEQQFSSMLPSLDQVTITGLSTGTIATWLIECPLDFEERP